MSDGSALAGGRLPGCADRWAELLASAEAISKQRRKDLEALRAEHEALKTRVRELESPPIRDPGAPTMEQIAGVGKAIAGKE